MQLKDTLCKSHYFAEEDDLTDEQLTGATWLTL